VFKILDFSTQKSIIQELPPYKTAELLNELPADDRTAFLEELPSEVVKELIRLLDPEERKITLSLLGYRDGSVGRLMTPDYIAVQVDWTMTEVLDHIRKEGKHSETIDVIYVVNDRGEFVDDVRIREILLADPSKVIEEIIDYRSITLNVNDAQEVANQIFKMNNRVTNTSCLVLLRSTTCCGWPMKNLVKTCKRLEVPRRLMNLTSKFQYPNYSRKE
jgi:magnesium transporter